MERTKTDLRAVSIARLIIGGFFMFEGVMRLTSTTSPSATEEMWGFTLSIPVVIVLSLSEIVLGFMIAIRNHTRIATALMAAHVIIVALLLLVLVDSASDVAVRTLLYKDIAIVGGLLFIHGHSRT